MTATLGAHPLPAAAALDLVRSLQPADLADLFPAPILCVDLADAAPADLTALAARRPPLVLVGVGPGGGAGPAGVLGGPGEPGRPGAGVAAEALDVLLPEVLQPGDDVPTAVAALERAVTDHPAAAVALVGLLRMVPRLEPLDGLVAESLAYSTLLAGGDFAGWLAARGPRRHRDADRPLLRRRDGDRLVLTFNRPEARNAFDTFTRDALVAALRAASADATLTEVVLTATGPSFGAGGDLSQFGTAGDLARAHLVRTGVSAGAEIVRCPRRVVAYLHGACVGAGIEIPAFADRVVAAPDVAIQLPELALGLVPGAGGTVSVTRRIGRRRTAWLVLTRTFLDAPTALRWGLVDAVEDHRRASPRGPEPVRP
ncbi:enoyl-CoA hydratase/isomerase family protein [Pseudofrankia sp. DC12]|uniref:enoyl-CoA hydratase/isomerase family protein n=1 Tax=Pseudofrankia sp. DC12 TaxID=683315 RepID=UPI0006961896|nr:enoyl-CoA hydratase/isomerase family protein [Pseudofrankia sp. DC12]